MSEIEIKVGQIWADADPRFERKIKVVKVLNEHIWIQGLGTAGNGRELPIRAAKRARFNGKRGGYKLIESI